MNSRPTRLFKYCRPPGVVILENRSLRFTRVASFNDPFELFPTLDSYLRPLTTALVLELLKASHRSKMQTVMEEHLGDEARLLGFDRKLEEDLRDEDSRLHRSLRRTVRQALRTKKIGSGERRRILATARSYLNDRFGVLCLAEKPDDLLMWSHYADSHHGFCLEFDSRDQFFDQRSFPGDPLRCVRRVRYQDGRPAAAQFDERYWLRSPGTAAHDLLTYMAGVLLLVKSSDWSYEREWRMVLPLPPEGADIVDFPPHCLRGVILGSAIEHDVDQRIVQVLESPDFEHVELRRAERDSRRFRIVVRDDASVLENRLLEDVGSFPASGVRQRIDRLAVSGPKFYAAVESLSRRGLLSAPLHDRSRQRKRLFALTEEGAARLAQRRRAAGERERAERTAASRFVDAGIAEPERFAELFAGYLSESLAEKKPGPRLGLDDPQIAAAFQALSDDEERVAWGAAENLREIGDGMTVEPLLSILRASEFEELIWLQDPHQEADLDDDEIAGIEGEAPIAYWVLGDKSAWGSDELRVLAIFALCGIVARVSAEEAVEPLIALLADRESDIRRHAAEALGFLGSDRALPELRRLAEEDTTDSAWGPIPDAARLAIKRIEKAKRRNLPWE